MKSEKICYKSADGQWAMGNGQWATPSNGQHHPMGNTIQWATPSNGQHHPMGNTIQWATPSNGHRTDIYM